MSSRNGAKAIHLATHSGWYCFEKQGKDWVPVVRALTYWSVTCLAVDPEDPRVIYAGTEHSGLFISRDGGNSWKRSEPNVPQLMVASLLALPGSVLVGTVPAALYRSMPGGWEELEDLRRLSNGSTFPPSPDLGARTRYLAADPQAPTRLYAGIEVGGLLVSDDRGACWESANDGLLDPDVHQFFPSRRRPEIVLATCGEGVFRSRDRASHWEKITPPGPRTYGMSVAEDISGMVYLGIACGRPNTWLRASRADAAVFHSGDWGTHWTVAVEGLKGGVMDLCANPEGEGVLAVTSEGELFAIDRSRCRLLASGLPCITAVAVGG
jgi:photosystem II stability/assembly factor-like uncharacterized protein